MGREYEYDEWLEFLTGSDWQPKAAKRAQRQFEKRVEELVDAHLPEDAEYPNMDEVAYLTYASLAGEGIGLWEGREDWHEDFHEVVKDDRPLSSLYYEVESEVERGD